MEVCRIYIGNLPNDVTEDSILKKFSKYDVCNVDLKKRENSSFAFINVPLESAAKCIDYFRDKKWKENIIKIEAAKESFVDRLKNEIESEQSKRKAVTSSESSKKLPTLTKSFPKSKVNHSGKSGSDFEKKQDDSQYSEENSSVSDSNEDENSHKIAETRRIEALRQKRRLYQRNKQIIQEALSKQNDGNKMNKKIHFDDDVDDVKNQVADNKKEEPKTKLVLFEDDEESDEFEPNFENNLQLEDDKAEKLLKLKAKIVGDERFKLDERFLDDEIKPEKQTKEKQGHTLDTTDSRSFRPVVHYDPSKPEHEKYVKSREQSTQPKSDKLKKKKKKKKPEIDSLNLPPAPEVSAEKYYVVSDKLKDSFKQTDGERFSLMKMFEQSHIMADKSEKKKVENNRPQKFVRNPIEYDSSESDSDDVSPIDVALNSDFSASANNVTDTRGIWQDRFFYKENDPRLEDADQFYTQVETRCNFEDVRTKLRSILKKKLQNSLKAKRMFDQNVKGKLNKTKFKMRLKRLNTRRR